MITLRHLTLRRGPTVLLENINWTIYPAERIGIIGENGSGKSSLFALLLGALEPDRGEIKIARHLNIAHVAQETPSYQKSALEFVLDGDEELRLIQHELQRAEKAHDGIKIAELHQQLSIVDGYYAPSRAAQLLSGLGFSQKDQEKSVAHFSGGWRMRLNLAKALMCRSDLLLLDEPTNHLDLDALLWLETWLKQYQGTILLISHDRDFLDQTIDQIAHIAQHQLRIYAGNYSSYEKQHASELLLQQSSYEKQQKKLAHLQKFVDRFRAKATKAKQAQSRLKVIEKMDLICAVQTESQFQFQFRLPKQCPNPLLQIERASVRYDEKIILDHIQFSVSPKERIAILGPNGAGKSTFIKLLAGEIITQGERIESPGLKIGYFAQHQVDHLQLSESAFLHLRRIEESAQDLELRTHLGSFGFSGDRIFSPIENFSGGEKARLALALLVWQKPNLLLLDEPTNHLDLDMRSALSIALQEFEGAMILVTHDRFLVRSTTDQLLLIADTKLQSFDGDLEDYERWLIDFRKREAMSEINKNNLTTQEKPINTRELKRQLIKKIKQLENAVSRLQIENSKIEKMLEDESLYIKDNKNKLQKIIIEQATIKQNLHENEEALLIAYEELELYGGIE